MKEKKLERGNGVFLEVLEYVVGNKVFWGLEIRMEVIHPDQPCGIQVITRHSW
jgi:hypothetical protein